MVGFLSWLNFPGSTLTVSQTCIWLTVTLSLAPPLWMDHSCRLLLALSTSVLSGCEFESQRQCLSSSLQWLQWEQTGVLTCGAENNYQPSCQPSDPIRSILFSLFGALPPGILFPSIFWPLCWRENSLRIWGITVLLPVRDLLHYHSVPPFTNCCPFKDS